MCLSSSHNSELATVSYQLTACRPKGRSCLFSGILRLMNRIMLHRFLTDCTLLHCNFLEKRDLSTPGCCPGVAGCCFADELLYGVHTEQLPSVYLCVGSPLFSSHMPSICEWEARAPVQEALCWRRRRNPTFKLRVLSHKNEQQRVFKRYCPIERLLSVHAVFEYTPHTYTQH